jgi:hypothetical protein
MAEQLARLGISEREYDMTATAQATASTTTAARVAFAASQRLTMGAPGVVTVSFGVGLSADTPQSNPDPAE